MYIDLLIKLKNAQAARKRIVEEKFSKLNKAIVDILEEAGFLSKVEIKGKAPKLFLELRLNKEKPIRGIKILSRPSLRRYLGYKNFYKVKGGQGLLVVSTSKGIMTAQKAQKNKLGGQLLFEIW
jgi:small subunit ribosomal protein S8